jgi:hypothetical protein
MEKVMSLQGSKCSVIIQRGVAQRIDKVDMREEKRKNKKERRVCDRDTTLREISDKLAQYSACISTEGGFQEKLREDALKEGSPAVRFTDSLVRILRLCMLKLHRDSRLDERLRGSAGETFCVGQTILRLPPTSLPSSHSNPSACNPDLRCASVTGHLWQ